MQKKASHLCALVPKIVACADTVENSTEVKEVTNRTVIQHILGICTKEVTIPFYKDTCPLVSMTALLPNVQVS